MPTSCTAGARAQARAPAPAPPRACGSRCAAPATPISSSTSKAALLGVRRGPVLDQRQLRQRIDQEHDAQVGVLAPAAVWMPSRSASHSTWLAMRRGARPPPRRPRAGRRSRRSGPRRRRRAGCAKSCGDMVVLPCGARSTPHARARSPASRRCCAPAPSRLITASGNGRSSASTFQPCAADLAAAQRRLRAREALEAVSSSGSMKSSWFMVGHSVIRRPCGCRRDQWPGCDFVAAAARCCAQRLDRVRAAGAEHAARRRVDRARHVALQQRHARVAGAGSGFGLAASRARV